MSGGQPISRQADYFQTGRISRQADNPVRQTTSKQADNIQTGRLLRGGQPILGRQTISRGAVNIKAGKLLPGRQTTLRRGYNPCMLTTPGRQTTSRQADNIQAGRQSRQAYYFQAGSLLPSRKII